MWDRLIIVLVVVVSSALLVAWNQWRSHHINKGQAAENWLTKLSAKPGEPALLYLWSHTCDVCHSVQRPAVERVAKEVGAPLSLVSLNAVDYPEITRELRVHSVPATIIVGDDGRVRHINRGLTDVANLRAQLADVMSPVPMDILA